MYDGEMLMDEIAMDFANRGYDSGEEIDFEEEFDYEEEDD